MLDKLGDIEELFDELFPLPRSITGEITRAVMQSF